MKKIYFLVLLCTTTFLLQAQWKDNTFKNTLVANKDASDIQTANTNDGRTWIAFYSQNGANYDMRAQLLKPNGTTVFGDTGVLVSNRKSGSATFVFNVCVDQDNNFIIAYQVEKGSTYECVMQKINAAGKLLWSRNGVDLGSGLSPYPAVLSTNDIAVAWNDNNGKIDYQKVYSAGVRAWDTRIFTGNSGHIVSRAQVVAGTNGTFSMVYQDEFSPPFYTHLFEQKFDNDGNALWASAVQISNLATASYRYYDVHSENDTTYVGYYGNPSGSNRFNAYVQRINPDGSLPYGINGAAFAPAFSGNNDPYEQTTYIAKQPSSDYVWAVCTVTNSLQTESGVYAQKFNAADGSIYLSTTAKEVLPIDPSLFSLAFCQLSLCDDNPVFLATSNTNKLIAIKLNENGNFAWKNRFTPVGSSTNVKFRYGFTNFYKGQAVAVWQEDKGDGNKPYAQNIRCNGNTGQNVDFADVSETKTLSIKNIYPNPAVNNLTARISSSTQTTVHIYITDVSGNVLKQVQQNLQKGDNIIQLNVNTIKPGSYFIKVMNELASASTLFNKQ